MTSAGPEVPVELAAATEYVTRRLVAIPSASPGPGELTAAKEALRLLGADGRGEGFAVAGLDPIAGDHHARANAYALVMGLSLRTVVLFGHLDTVGTADYGPLEYAATDPDRLAANLEALTALDPDLAGIDPSEWLFGRGAADMKGGVAAAIAVARELAAGDPPHLTVLVVATADEENESAGILQALRLLHRLRAERNLRYVGAINTDYVTARFPGDSARSIYTGTVGKLLVGFYAVGLASHAGDPFAGLDANLIVAELVRDLSLDSRLADAGPGFLGPPPVTLRVADLKDRYDTQLPLASHLELNVLTVTTEPGRVLARLRRRALVAARRAVVRAARSEARWRKRAGLPAHLRGDVAPTVHTYAEVLRLAVADVAFADAVEAEHAGWTPAVDSRRRSLALVGLAWKFSGLVGPAVVLYLAPPYYPHLAPADSPLLDAVREVVAHHEGEQLLIETFFPLLSDMSYLRLEAGVNLAALTSNMPLWDGGDGSGYSVPLDLIRELDIPVVNIGPLGFAAHRPGERVHRHHAFEVVPGLIIETIAALARRTAG